MTYNAAMVAETLHQAGSYGFSLKETAPFDWATFKHKRDAYVARLNDIYERACQEKKWALACRGHVHALPNSEAGAQNLDSLEGTN